MDTSNQATKSQLPRKDNDVLNLVKVFSSRELGCESKCRPYLHRAVIDQTLENANYFFRKNITGHYGCVNALEFTHDGKYLVSGGDDLKVRLWKTEELISGARTGDKVMEAEHQNNIFCLDFNCTNTKILSAGNDDRVIIHDMTSGAPIDFFIHEQPVYGVSAHPSSDNLFSTAGDDGRILTFDLRYSIDCPHVVARSRHSFHSVMYHPVEPTFIVTANDKEGVALWDLRITKTPIIKYGPFFIKQTSMSAKFNQDGTQIMALRRRLPPILYSTFASLKFCQFNNPGYYNACTMKSCSFAGSKDQFVLAGSDNFDLCMWKIPNLETENWIDKATHVLRGHRSIVNQVRYNKYHNVIVSSGVEKILKLWSPWPINNVDGKNCPTNEQGRVISSRDEYIELSLIGNRNREGNTDEDNRMLAFFDALVQRDINASSDETESINDLSSYTGLPYAYRDLEHSEDTEYPQRQVFLRTFTDESPSEPTPGARRRAPQVNFGYGESSYSKGFIADNYCSSDSDSSSTFFSSDSSDDDSDDSGAEIAEASTNGDEAKVISITKIILNHKAHQKRLNQLRTEVNRYCAKRKKISKMRIEVRKRAARTCKDESSDDSIIGLCSPIPGYYKETLPGSSLSKKARKTRIREALKDDSKSHSSTEMSDAEITERTESPRPGPSRDIQSSASPVFFEERVSSRSKRSRKRTVTVLPLNIHNNATISTESDSTDTSDDSHFHTLQHRSSQTEPDTTGGREEHEQDRSNFNTQTDEIGSSEVQDTSSAPQVEEPQNVNVSFHDLGLISPNVYRSNPVVLSSSVVNYRHFSNWAPHRRRNRLSMKELRVTVDRTITSSSDSDYEYVAPTPDPRNARFSTILVECSGSNAFTPSHQDTAHGMKNQDSRVTFRKEGTDDEEENSNQFSPEEFDSKNKGSTEKTGDQSLTEESALTVKHRNQNPCAIDVSPPIDDNHENIIVRIRSSQAGRQNIEETSSDSSASSDSSEEDFPEQHDSRTGTSELGTQTEIFSDDDEQDNGHSSKET